MNKINNLWLAVPLVLIAVTLLFPAQKVFAWGSSSYGSGYDSSSRYSSGSSYNGSNDTYGGWGGSLTEDDCRNCHEDLKRFPQLEDTNPDKHHILVGLNIPWWTVAPYGNSGEDYDCFSCHSVDQIDDSVFEIPVIRDCLECHPSRTVTGYSGNVHHQTPTARARQCGACHGWGSYGGSSSGYGW